MMQIGRITKLEGQLFARLSLSLGDLKGHASGVSIVEGWHQPVNSWKDVAIYSTSVVRC